MECVYTEIYRGLKLEIYKEENPINPLETYKCLGTFVCLKHPRHKLGHIQFNQPIEVISYILNCLKLEIPKTTSFEEFMEEAYELMDQHSAWVELYLYDVETPSISTSKLAEFWNTGTFGIAFVSKDILKEELGLSEVLNKHVAQAEELLFREVQKYNAFLNGNVFEVKIDNLESISPYYSIEDAKKVGREVIDGLLREKEPMLFKAELKSGKVALVVANSKNEAISKIRQRTEVDITVIEVMGTASMVIL